MFKKTERMSKREFDTVFKAGKRTHFPHLTILTAHAAERKVAAVVGKKVARSAVRRNTVRRRIYAVVRDVLLAHDYQAAMIIITKPPFNSLTRTAAEQCLREAVEQVVKNS